jgi:hypothetical protein
MSRTETLIAAVETSRETVHRFLVGFDEVNRTRQAPGMPNHAAWTLGHLALTLHRCAERVDGVDLPAADFLTGDGHAGTAERYDTESICFNSQPADEPDHYPALQCGAAIFNAACDRLIATVRGATDAQLDAEIQWFSGSMSMFDLLLRVTFHNALHAGQLVDLRRGLGLAPTIPV